MEPSFCGQLFPFTGPQAKDLLSQTPDQDYGNPKTGGIKEHALCPWPQRDIPATVWLQEAQGEFPFIISL